MTSHREEAAVENGRNGGDADQKKENDNWCDALCEETKHFTNTTTMHGPKRIYNGRNIPFRVTWAVVSALAVIVLGFTIYHISTKFFSWPTTGQVEFILSEGGMVFPAVTICNLNPIKLSDIRKYNKSGDLTPEVLKYLLRSNMDIMFLYSNLNRERLEAVHNDALDFMKKHKEFRIQDFLNDVGHTCNETFVKCYFGGHAFNCCKYMTHKITSIGKCYQMDFTSSAPDEFRKQLSPGSEAGLQIIADAKLDEEMNTNFSDDESFFFDIFEPGFRYFIHEPFKDAELASEGVSVSPSRVVYSAIKKSTHELLDPCNWGSCAREFPYNTTLKVYSAPSCRSLCLAAHFQAKCDCSPFTFNIDGSKKICLPYESVKCMVDHMTDVNTKLAKLPNCGDICHLECSSTTYTAFNSYGDGFNKGSVQWLSKLGANYTKEHVRKNFAIINIFYSEMIYTSYKQVRASSWPEYAANMGGLAGLFLGISFVTILEVSLYIVKIAWLIFRGDRRKALCKKRRFNGLKLEWINQNVEEYEKIKGQKEEPQHITQLTQRTRISARNQA